MIYLASYIFIGLPGWKIMQMIFKSEKLYASKIVDEIFKNGERSDEMFKQSSIFFKRSLLYLYIRSKESNSSSDVKFSFTQLMYGRSILLIIDVVLFIFYNVTFNDNILIYAFIFYIISILLHAIGLRFFDDILSCGYIVEKINEKKKDIKQIKMQQQLVVMNHGKYLHDLYNFCDIP